MAVTQSAEGTRVNSWGLRRWLGTGAWAVTDQGLFASSNFVVNIVLARWLPPDEYGVFTLGYTWFLLLATGHTALLTEPMLVFGSGKYQSRLSAYLAVVLRGHWLLTGIASAVLLLGALALSAMERMLLASMFFALACVTPLVLLQWLMRRACYLRMQPQRAAQAGAVYMVLLLSGTYLLDQRGWLTSVSVLFLMGGASLGSSAVIVRSLKIHLTQSSVATSLRDVLADHWTYGRWVIGTGVLSWIPASIYYVLLPTRQGLDATAALKALMNLIMPILHTYLALSTLLLPTLVRVQGTPEFRRTARTALTVGIGGALAYWLILGASHRGLVTLVYGGHYSTHSDLLWIIGLLPVSGTAVAVLGSMLRAVERPDLVFVAYAASTIAALTLGLGLMIGFGIAGAALGLLMSSIISAAVMAWSAKRHWRIPRAEPS